MLVSRAVSGKDTNVDFDEVKAAVEKRMKEDKAAGGKKSTYALIFSFHTLFILLHFDD